MKKINQLLALKKKLAISLLLIIILYFKLYLLALLEQNQIDLKEYTKNLHLKCKMSKKDWLLKIYGLYWTGMYQKNDEQK